jgi:hypothetical protein
MAEGLSEEELWREKELLRVGYPSEEARVMAMRRDIDLHEALKLVENGCDPRLAFGILM